MRTVAVTVLQPVREEGLEPTAAKVPSPPPSAVEFAAIEAIGGLVVMIFIIAALTIGTMIWS